jgi:hypothetical protein
MAKPVVRSADLIAVSPNHFIILFINLIVLSKESTGLFHNFVQASGPDPKSDFKGRDLRALLFFGAVIEGFDFSGSDLRGTCLRDAKRISRTNVFARAQLDDQDRKWLDRELGSDVSTPDREIGLREKRQKQVGTVRPLAPLADVKIPRTFLDELSRTFLDQLYRIAVAAAHPAASLVHRLPDPPRTGRVILLAAGTPAGSMTEIAERHYLDDLGLLPSRLLGAAVTRRGYARPTRIIRVTEAGHPVPDHASLAPAERALTLAAGATADDLVLILLSGGASANWIAPAAGLTLAEKQAVNRAQCVSIYRASKAAGSASSPNRRRW